MIVSFGDAATEDLFHGRNSSRVRRFSTDVLAATLRKLDVLRAAQSIQDLRSPPGNRLEGLRGDYAGYHSIRVNQQWRLVFRWASDGAHEVKLEDYH